MLLRAFAVSDEQLEGKPGFDASSSQTLYPLGKECASADQSQIIIIWVCLLRCEPLSWWGLMRSNTKCVLGGRRGRQACMTLPQFVVLFI